MCGPRLHQTQPAQHGAPKIDDGEKRPLRVGDQRIDMGGECGLVGKRPELHLGPGGSDVLVMRKPVERDGIEGFKWPETAMTTANDGRNRQFRIGWLAHWPDPVAAPRRE